MPAKRSSIRLMPGFVSVQLAIEGQSEASWLSEWMLANILERREAPFASLYCARNSYFSFAISTFEGHSALHPLHSRHRSSVSYSSFPVNSYAGNLPDKISRIKLARPRVECLSSMVTMYDGHMVPSFFLRQTPAPLHSSTAVANPPSREKL